MIKKLTVTVEIQLSEVDSLDETISLIRTVVNNGFPGAVVQFRFDEIPE